MVHQAHGGYDMVAPRRQAHPVLLHAQQKQGNLCADRKGPGSVARVSSVVRARLTDLRDPPVSSSPPFFINSQRSYRRRSRDPCGLSFRFPPSAVIRKPGRGPSLPLSLAPANRHRRVRHRCEKRSRSGLRGRSAASEARHHRDSVLGVGPGGVAIV